MIFKVGHKIVLYLTKQTNTNKKSTSGNVLSLGKTYFFFLVNAEANEHNKILRRLNVSVNMYILK